MDKFQVNINHKNYRLSELAAKIKLKAHPEWLLGVFRFVLEWSDASDSITQNTSGSTGQPKAIELKKKAMTASAKRTISFFDLHENETVWLCLPIDYIAGKMQVVRSLVGGLKLLVTEPVAKPDVPNVEIKFAALVPMQLQRMLDENQAVNNIDILILGGAATSVSLAKRLQGIKTKVYATYGMTETCSHVALQKINGTDPDASFFVLDGIQISKNKQNCLQIDAPDLLEAPISTNDIVEIIDDRHFKVLGRSDNIINSGGLKISPEEIEAAIAQEFNLEVILLGVSDDHLGQKLILVSEVLISDELWLELSNFITLKFGKNKVPKLRKQISKFPRSQSMKILRSELAGKLHNDKI